MELTNGNRRTGGFAALLLGAFLLAPFLLVGVGCSGTPMESTPSVPDRTAGALKSRDYKRVYLVKPGGPETDVHVGYTAIEYFLGSDGVERPTTWVYDTSAQVIGFFFIDGGATYVYDDDNKPVNMGNQEPNRSLEIIYDRQGLFNEREDLTD